MAGYTGRLLEVDLSTRETGAIVLPSSIYAQFLGGYGLGARLLYDVQEPGVDALSGSSRLMFATGPLVGTPTPMAARYTIMGKSPLTGTWGDANSGGNFGTFLKFASYDAILFAGSADAPVYLWIENGRAELRNAEHLWGQGTSATVKAIQRETHAQAEVVCIGPAGERQSLISCIIGTGGRAAGRSGLGAVMGSKNLKAVAIYGDQGVPVAQPQRMVELREHYLTLMSGPYAEGLREFGTCVITEEAIEYGSAPIKNWKGVAGVDFTQAQNLGGEAVAKLEIEKQGCFGCPIRCGGIVQVGKIRTRKPEHETLSAFGPLCLNSDLPSIVEANALCDDYGLDTISTGSAIAFAMECHENGVLSETQTRGLNLEWGNSETVVQLTKQIAHREGLGDLLADGVKRAASRIGQGAESLAVHVHGQEPAMHDPKFSPGYATSYQIDATPGRHTQGGAANLEGLAPEGISHPELRKHEYSGKGEAHRLMSSLVHVVNASGLCLFGIQCMDVQAIPQFLTAAMGIEWDMDMVHRAGERIATMRHAFNLREGVNSVDFRLPKRLLQGVSRRGRGWAEVNIDLDVQLRDYLRAMDWDAQTGKPSRARLTELGLDDLVEDMYE